MPEDEINIRPYCPLVEGASDWISSAVVQGMSSRSIAHTDFVDATSFADGTNPLLAKTGTVNTSTDVWTTLATVWAGCEPVKFSTTTTLPASTPQIVAGTIYFAGIINTTTFKVYTTATNCANAASAIDFTDTGTGTHTVTGLNSATFGPRIKAYILAPGSLWVEGAHVKSTNELTYGEFVLDTLASMVNAGEAQFVTSDDLISGNGIVKVP